MHIATIKVNDAKLLATIRGQAVRPVQRHRDRRKEAANRECRKAVREW